MKIVVDENIPFAQALLKQHGEVVPVDGRNIAPAQLADADALLIRSITKVNAALLSQAQHLKFIGTATIGTEHVDQTLLAEKGITFASAPGCNARSVAQYVTSALLAAAQFRQQSLKGKSFAVIGAGNTGSATARCAQALGMKVLFCDPPLEQQGKLAGGISLQQALQADVISLHVPLDQYPEFPTRYLIGVEQLQALSPQQVLINACRGAVVDNRALLAQAKASRAPLLIWDVWEHEPKVITELVEHCFIATPHIAGYSLEGKMTGTSMIYHAMCQALKIEPNDLSQQLLPEAGLPTVTLQPPFSQQQVAALTRLVYDLQGDDKRFREFGLTPEGFDRLRKTYPERREFSVLQINSAFEQALAELGFTYT
ncbi:4-phosphoerythronate dehydrogenase [Aliagarivorans taiwanensis]|uniref:4-phosphoerythronate dehydrogenase n=1 Tax=Aliagarivorans taiwanensis TaxID=561966 RepID=UPI00040098E7|nr:4-phosphoerythronate dehydrogenase [Aliagarivorans taiwanensis]